MYIASIEQKVREGKAFWAGTGIQALTVIAGNFKITFENPSGSGKIAYLYALVSTTDAAGMFTGNLFQNPSTSLPSTSINTFNQDRGSANTAACLLKMGTSGTAMAAGTGTVLPPLSVPNGRTVFETEFLKIPAGITLGINVSFLISANAAMRVFWWEE